MEERKFYYKKTKLISDLLIAPIIFWLLFFTFQSNLSFESDNSGMKLFYLIILTYIIIDSIFRFIMRWRKDIILSFDKAGINSCFLTEPILWEKVSDIDLNSATFTKEIVIFCDNKVSFFRRLTIINKSFFHMRKSRIVLNMYYLKGDEESIYHEMHRYRAHSREEIYEEE